jgi:hypothetical protein
MQSNSEENTKPSSSTYAHRSLLETKRCLAARALLFEDFTAARVCALTFFVPDFAATFFVPDFAATFFVPDFAATFLVPDFAVTFFFTLCFFAAAIAPCSFTQKRITRRIIAAGRGAVSAKRIVPFDVLMNELCF